MKFSRKIFFDGFRNRIDSTIEQEQVDGLEFLLGRFETDKHWGDVRHIAYALATIFHETAGSFQPVEEGYYLGAAKAKRHQKTLRYYPFFGRGYVQLTWSSNYEKAGNALGLDLVKQPELALKPDSSFDILTLGLFRGWFGGKLTTYINAEKTDYVNARRCINILDKAGLIAGYARSFEKILRDSAKAPADKPIEKPAEEPAIESPQTGIDAPGVSPQDEPSPTDAPLVAPPEPIPTPPQAEGQTIVDVPPVVTDVPESLVSKAKGWHAMLPAGVVSFFGGVWSWIQGASTEITIGFFSATAVIVSVWIVTNYLGKKGDKQLEHEAREKQKDRDFELTKLQMQSAMDEKLQTVRVAPPVIVVPASEEVS